MLVLTVLTAWSTLTALPDTTKKKTDSLPLATTRSVEFETSDGTWLSLDLSPDGRYAPDKAAEAAKTAL